MDLAYKIVDLILKDLEGRKGIGDELDQIDDEIHEELTEELVQLIRSVLPISPILSAAEIVARIRQYAEVMEFRCRDVETAAQIRAFADRVEAEAKEPAPEICSVCGLNFGHALAGICQGCRGRILFPPSSPTLRELVKPVEAAIALQRLCQWEFCAQYHPVPYCNINALDVTIETGRLVEPPTGIVEKCKLCHALYDLAQKGKADGEN